MPYPDLVSSAEPSPRPQSLMLTFFGIHVLGRDLAVSSGSVIDALGRVGVSEEAVRSTLTRMVGRGLLERHRQGRKMYFALTPRAVSVLQDGHDRIWRRGAANLDWDGQWTLVGFSLPEAWRRERHDLRSRLTWGGFGPLQNGLWIAPSARGRRRPARRPGSGRAPAGVPRHDREADRGRGRAGDGLRHRRDRRRLPGVPAALVAARIRCGGPARKPAAAAHRLAGPGAAATRTCRPSICPPTGPPSRPRSCSTPSRRSGRPRRAPRPSGRWTPSGSASRFAMLLIA